jgi:hypothetical protein
MMQNLYELGINLMELPLWQRILIATADFPSVLFSILSLWSLSKLLKQYTLGNYFTEKTVGFISHIGLFALLSEVAAIMQQLPVSYFSTFMNPPGNRFISISLSNANLNHMMLAIAVLILGWVMAQAAKLQHDANGTI